MTVVFVNYLTGLTAQSMVERSTVCNSKSCAAPVVQMNRPWIT